MPGGVLGARDTVVNKASIEPHSYTACSRQREADIQE